MSGFNEDGNKDNVSESNKEEDDHINAEAVESEDEEENCVESVLKEFNKDISALYSKTNKIEGDLKQIAHLKNAFDQFRQVSNRNRPSRYYQNFLWRKSLTYVKWNRILKMKMKTMIIKTNW